MFDTKKALLDPESVFASPAAVVTCKELTKEQKIKVLHRWEYDMREIEVAEEENMTGNSLDILDEILKALLMLGVTPSHKHWAPTKQGGL